MRSTHFTCRLRRVSQAAAAATGTALLLPTLGIAAFPVAAGLLIGTAGCGGTNGNQNPRGSLAFDVNFPARSRGVATATDFRAAEALRLTVTGNAQNAGFSDVIYRQNTSESHIVSYRSREVDLATIGGPIAFRDGAQARVTITLYADRETTRQIGSIDLTDARIDRDGDTGLLRIYKSGETSPVTNIDALRVDISREFDTLVQANATSNSVDGTTWTLPVGILYTPTIDAKNGSAGSPLGLPAGALTLTASPNAAYALEGVNAITQNPKGGLRGTRVGTDTISLDVDGLPATANLVFTDRVAVVGIGSDTAPLDRDGEGISLDPTQPKERRDLIPLTVGQTRNFSALLNYSASSNLTISVPEAVNWSVVGTDGRALQSVPNGVFTPQTPGEYLLEARSVLDSFNQSNVADTARRNESQTVARRIRVTVVPASAVPITAQLTTPQAAGAVAFAFTTGNQLSAITMPASSSALPIKLQFAAGPPSGATVIWAVTEGDAGGTVTGSGNTIIYTAPNHAGVYHLRATRADRPDLYGEVLLTVRAETIGAVVN